LRDATYRGNELITTFLTESIFVLGLLAGLSAAGGFLVLPFRKSRKYVALASPLAGLFVLALGTGACYSVLGKSLVFCASLCELACIGASLVAFLIVRPTFRWRGCILPAAATLVVVSLITFSTDTATICLDQPAVQYMDGTDHLGYGQMADWLSVHTVAQLPQMSPDAPYEAFPTYLVHGDPRFGSFFAMSIIRSIRGLSGAFTYDIACAVVLSAAILALAGIFARSFFSMLIVLVGLTTCHWFDFSRSGYLGKLLGFPGCLLVAGLFLSADVLSPPVMSVLVILTAATAVMYSGIAMAVFLSSIIGCYLLCQIVLEPSSRRVAKLSEVLPAATLLGALIVVAVVAIGSVARPLATPFPDYGVGWGYVLPRILDLENQGARVTSLSPVALNWFMAGAFGVWLALIAAAVRLRDGAAAGLLVGPLLLLLALIATGQRAAAFQTIGTYYPFSICAAALLIDQAALSVNLTTSLRRRAAQAFIFILAACCVGLRFPRYRGALDRYAGKEDPTHSRFSKGDEDRLASLMAGQPVIVDVINPEQACFVLIELGPHEGVHFDWTARAWTAIVGYAHWPVPKPARPDRYMLVPVGEDGNRPVIFRTSQYDLLDISTIPATQPAPMQH
jgi:hypothetical protein